MSHLLLLAALLLGAADALVGPLVVGLNKYSHDASICVADAATGEPLLVWAKERLTRRKLITIVNGIEALTKHSSLKPTGDLMSKHSLSRGMRNRSRWGQTKQKLPLSTRCRR